MGQNGLTMVIVGHYFYGMTLCEAGAKVLFFLTLGLLYCFIILYSIMNDWQGNSILMDLR